MLCDCYLNADMECSVGACAAQLKSIGTIGVHMAHVLYNISQDTQDNVWKGKS